MTVRLRQQYESSTQDLKNGQLAVVIKDEIIVQLVDNDLMTIGGSHIWRDHSLESFGWKCRILKEDEILTIE